MMSPKIHRKRERKLLRSVRYSIQTRGGQGPDYDLAFRNLVWAHQQSVAAETKEKLAAEAKLSVECPLNSFDKPKRKKKS